MNDILEIALQLHGKASATLMPKILESLELEHKVWDASIRKDTGPFDKGESSRGCIGTCKNTNIVCTGPAR